MGTPHFESGFLFCFFFLNQTVTSLSSFLVVVYINHFEEFYFFCTAAVPAIYNRKPPEQRVLLGFSRSNRRLLEDRAMGAHEGRRGVA